MGIERDIQATGAGHSIALPNSVLLGCFLRLTDKRLQVRFEDILVLFGKVNEAEGLQPSLRGPHGKQHLGSFADGRLAEMKNYLNFEFLIERFVHVQ